MDVALVGMSCDIDCDVTLSEADDLRYRGLAARGKPTQLIVTAIARELTGFLWAALTQ